jgi:uncharacterized protein YqgC (DUF456 family)
MEWLLYVVAVLFTLLSAGGVLLCILQLPGGWLILGLAAIVEVVDRWYLPAGNQQTFPWWLLIASLGLLTVGEVIELVASALGARGGGATRRGMIGSLIGAMVGAIVLTAPLAFIPVLGTLIGAVVGSFVGAVVGELSEEKARSLQSSIKPATGAAIGRVVGSMSKAGIAMVVWLALSVAAFWP